MAKYLVKRDGFWRFIRRVPKEYRALDLRDVVQHSTGIHVADDPRAICASKIALGFNEALENHWRDLADSGPAEAVRAYEAARSAARKMGIAPPDTLAKRTIGELLARIEKLEDMLAGKPRSSDRASVVAVYDAVPKPGITFKQCAERFIEAHKASWSNPKHATQWRTSLETYAYPIIGNIPVADIGSNGNGHAVDLIMRILEPIWHSKTETASRVRGRIEKVLDWAKARGYRDGENPARWKGHLDKLLPARSKVAPVKHHAALPYADLPAFMQRLRQQSGTAAHALEFTILTAARTAEVVGAKKSEIDRAARMWVVPKERMKGRREHRVALCDAALAIIDAAPAGEYLFPGNKPGKPMWKWALRDLLFDMGISEQVTTHGMRSTFRDWAAETTQYPNELLEMAIAHVIDSKTEAAYRRGDLLAKRHKLMADWESFCNSGS